MSHSNKPPHQNPYAAPVQPVQMLAYLNQPAMEGDKTGGIIPYKNPHALIGYYLGILGLLPVIGIPFGIAAIVLGIIGFRKRAVNPIIKSSAHASLPFVVGSCRCFAGVFLGRVT